MTWTRISKWTIVAIVATVMVMLLVQITSALNQVYQTNINDNNLLFSVEKRFVADENNEYDVATALIELKKQPITSLSRSETQFGEHSYWYQLDLKNLHRNTEDFVVLLDNPMLDEIEIWIYEQGVLTQSLLLGDLVFEHTLRTIAFPHINLNLPEGSSKTLIVKTKTLGAPNIFFAIFNEHDYQNYKDAVYILWGSFIGICILIIVYNIILYVGSNETLFLYYIGYVGAFFIELGIVHGYIYYLLPIELAGWVSQNVIVVNFILAYFAIMFAMHFLKYHQQKSYWLTKATYLMATFYLVFAVLSFSLKEYVAAQIFFSSQAVLYFIAIFMMVQRLLQGVRWANYYIISWLPLLVGAAVGPLLLTGHLEYSIWTRHALLFGVMFEVTFMSMALAQRLRMAETERMYQSSHEQRFGFANDQLLEQSIRRLINHNKSDFSIILVSLDNFDNYVPYLRKDDLSEVINLVAYDLESSLGSDLYLVDIDIDSRFKKVSMIRDGVFAFIVLSNDEFLLRSVFQRFSESQPLNYEVNGLTLNFYCYASAIEYSEHLNIYELTNQALQQIDDVRDKNDSFSIYTETTHTNNQKRIQLASDLQKAINDDTLQLYHQPQVSLKTGKVSGSEVLLRWVHEEYGNVTPPEFIKVAEDTGIINKLTRWVFVNACKHMVELKQAGMIDHRISVNVSVFDIMAEGFIAFLVETMEEYDVRTTDFIIELTETAASHDSDVFAKNLDELKDIGFILSIDDFGTGYSSLTYISKHPFDELKIDRDFVTKIIHSEVDLNIIKSTLALAQSLNYKVVAEGIEDQKTLSLLKQMNCDFVQGYFYSKPLPLDDYMDWLEEHQLKVVESD